MKIATSKLQEALSKTIKAVGNNKLLPITSLIGIKLESTELTLTSTTGADYLYVKVPDIQGEDLEAVVEADKFYGLVSRTTTEFIELSVEFNAIKVVGNGTYLFNLVLDENGTPIKFPNPVAAFKGKSKEIVPASVFATMRDLVKPSLATTFEAPCYTGYYVSEEVIGTNSFKMAYWNKKVFKTAKLLSADVVDLLEVIGSDSIECSFGATATVFKGNGCIIYDTQMAGIEDYQVQDIKAVVDSGYPISCSVSKAGLLAILERLSLFITKFDKNALRLTFTETGLQIQSKSSSGVEVIPYESPVDSKVFKPFTTLISIEDLMQEVKAIPKDVISLHYGEDGSALKMTYDDLVIVVAFLDDVDF